MYSRIKRSNRPQWTQPAQHKGPASRPCRQILSLSKDIAGTIALVGGTNGKSDYSGGDEDEVHDDKYGLELSHDFGHDGGEDCVAEDAGKEGTIDCAVGWGPVAVAGDDDYGKKH